MSENKNIGSIFRIQTHNCNNVQICNNVISSYGDISPNIAFDVMRGGYESLFLNNTYHNKENNSTIFLPDGINSKLNISYLQHYIPKNSYVLDNTDVEKTILIDSGETPIYTVRLLGEATTNGSITISDKTGRSSKVCDVIIGDTPQTILKKIRAYNTYLSTYVLITRDLVNSKFIVTYALKSTIDCQMIVTCNAEGITVSTDYKPGKAPILIKNSGTFANKPTVEQGCYVGFKYLCTDRKTTEGGTNGIMIYHKGNDVWVDALGRVVS